jgi:hypothetical protein
MILAGHLYIRLVALPTHMIRYISAIFILMAFAAQSFQQAFIVLRYYTNTASFVKNCENKTRPAMHCNGKCQMMKKLQEEEKRTGQAPERKLENSPEVLSSKSFFPAFPIAEESLSTSNKYPAPFFRLPQFSAAVFHPPAMV